MLDRQTRERVARREALPGRICDPPSFGTTTQRVAKLSGATEIIYHSGDVASICLSKTATAAELVASIRAEYDVDDETPLVALGFICRPGCAPFNRVTQDDVDEESELEGHVE